MIAVMTIPALAVGLLLLAAVEVLWSRLTGRRLFRSADGRPVAAGGFEEINAMFDGSVRNDLEQRQVASMDRDDAAQGDRNHRDYAARVVRLTREDPR